MAKLDGKVAVVTGGSSGIGLAMAKRFVAEGAYVFIVGRRQDVLSIRLDAMPVALSVTVCGELAVPTLWFPKVNSNVEGVSIALGGHGTKPPQPPQQTCEDTRIATLRHKVTLLKSLGQEQQSSGGREFVQLGSNHLSTFGTNRNDDRASYFQETLSVGRMGLGKIGHGCGLCHPSPKALPDYLWAWPTEWRPRSTYFPTGFCGA